jgi:hypothetical protein
MTLCDQASCGSPRPATLARAEAFWAGGPGLQVLERVQPGPGGGHHGRTPPAPTEEDQLMLYLGAPPRDALVARLAACGGTVVPARNPCWDRWCVTVADADGSRLVLSHRSWG